MRQFRATSLGEFAVALIIFAAMGTLFLPLLLSVAPTPAFAVDAVWLTNPPSGNWNSGENWQPTNAPVNPGDTASFNTSTNTVPTLSPAPNVVTINSITFNPGASAFTIQNGVFLTLQGVGIVNNSGVAQTINNSSFLLFAENSTAGNATINNSFTLAFTENSTAGNATINNLSILGFAENSTAGNATINNSSILVFAGNSTAGNATINNSLNLDFFGNSSGGNATINNLIGVESTGQTIFHNTSTAGNATINNVGDETSTQFVDNSTAANATITNRGAGSFTLFGSPTAQGTPPPTPPPSTATAANATITNSGSNSFTTFNQATSGGNAALINANPTAFISIAELDTAGTTVGSIAGNGTTYLGSKNLTVGGNQQSTVFSGVIADGRAPLPVDLLTGAGPFTGGSLTKVGSGTLTLTGSNTYSGGTNLNGGILAVNSDSNLGMGPLSFNGGTLEALGSGGGIISSKPVNLAAGGGTFLADAGTTSALSGLITGVGAWTKSGPGLWP